MGGHQLRRIGLAVAVTFCAVVGGTLGFRPLLHEPWRSAFDAELLTIMLALSGLAIFGYLAAKVFEAVAREVTGHAVREKRRRRMIEELRDHFISCGFGRIGRKATDEQALEAMFAGREGVGG